MKILLAETNERTEVFRRVFDTDIFNKITISLNNRQREVKERLQELKIEFSTICGGLDFYEKIDSKYINELLICEILENLKKQIIKNKEEFDISEKEVKEFEKEAKKFEEEHKEKIIAKQEVEKIQKIFDKLDKQLKELLNEEIKSKKFSENLKLLKANLKIYQEQDLKNKELDYRIKKLREIAKEKLEYEKYVKKYNLDEEEYKKQSQNYLEKEDEFFREQAGILAVKLEKDKPCPVCGSKIHPNPASKSEQVLSKKELDLLKKKLEENQKELNHLKEKITELNSKVKILIEELKIENDVIEEGKKIAKELEEGKSKLEKSYEIIDNSYKEISGKKIRLETFDFEKFQEEVNSKVLDIKENITKYKTLKEEKEKELKIKENIIKDIDFENIEKQIKSNKKKFEEKRGIFVKNKMKLENQKNILAKLEKISEKLVDTIKEFTILDELYKTSSGNLPGKTRINFEQYIQTNYFDMVVQEANKRFMNMTEGRFQLLRKEASSKISDKIALELEVLDYYNGKKRDVKSLSGGEAFKAALCLALGLSDIIQSYSGGVQVDTLFIDEGFGSLDLESREQAISTLNQLAGSNKLIGIISHVTELQERIEKKIVVEKEISGSKIRLEI